MSEEASAPAAAPRRRFRWARWLLGLVALLAVLAVGAGLLLDTQIGRRFVADRIAAMKPADGMRYRIGRIEGSLYGRATLIDVRVYDPRGLVLRVPRAELDWRPLAWTANRLDIRSLTVPRASLYRIPEPRRTGRDRPLLPDFDIAIGWLAIDRIDMAEGIAGPARSARLVARADGRRGRALVDLAGLVEGSDFVRFRLDAEPGRDRFDLTARTRGRGDGVVAAMLGTDRPIRLSMAGAGSWSRWRGQAQALLGEDTVAELRLGADAGRYRLEGDLTLTELLQGRMQRMAAPRIRLSGAATVANRRVDGKVSARSAAIAIETSGTVDLAESRYRNLQTLVRVLRPQAILPNMTGRGLELRAILDGPFSTARFDYRLTADRVAFDQTGFDGVRVAGRGRLSPQPVIVPVALTARTVTGVGEVAGGILRNLRVTGPLSVTSRNIASDRLELRSDKLSGRVMLFVDLRTGSYEVGLAGGLQRYLIPGLGVVDVDSRLRVVPGAGGGTRILGEGAARVVRLDNSFFATLLGGLPRVTTGLERGRDRILYFRNARLYSPLLNLSGNGFRRVDGSFYFEGTGRHAQYGPVHLKLNGDISRPRVELRLASPQATLGLADVQARLEPVAEGYRWRAEGGSRLGPFAGEGAILLPPSGTSSIEITRLDVAGAQAKGSLAIVEGGFDGRVDLAGGGLSGHLAFAPQNGVQRIGGDIAASEAALGNGLSVRRGRLRFATLLDPAGVTLEGEAEGQGLRQGPLSLARFRGSARLVDGIGDARVTVAGARGRGFAVDAAIAIAEDRYTVTGEGTIDRQPIKLLAPAVIRREEAGWRIDPTRLSFAGGEAQVGGLFGDDQTELRASLERMPLSVVDIVAPGMGLGGTASGTLEYAARADGPPTGAVDLTVRGLNRTALVQASQPIDLALRGVLRADQAGFRAVMASGGRTIGRAQARLTPLVGETLAERLANAPLFGQLRYSGPAATLWRLTGVEMFELSGPVAIGADIGGRLADPRIRGAIRTRGASLESAVTGTVLRGIDAEGRFDGSRLLIDRFQARDGRQGSVAGTGSFDFAAASGFAMDLRMQAANALLINRDDIAATVTGPITIRSDAGGGMIGGEVTVNSSRYQLGRAVTAAPIPRINVTEINRPGGEEEVAAAATPWRLDMRARIPGAMEVTGLGLSSEWSGDLRIGGEPTNPMIRGLLELVRGDYEFAGRTFDIDRGRIQFDGSVPANPALDIVANADTQGVNATIRVGGNALRPEISFQSVPALPEDELLSRLLFGTSITQLSAPEAVQLAAAVAALQEGGDGLNPINAVRRAAGLDRLRILAADPQTGQGTAIAAGKFVTRRTYVEIVSDGAGYSATRVEFQVTRWLSLLSSISTIGRQSANVRVSRDY